MEDLYTQLSVFAKSHRMNGKGPLCVALVVTRHAKRSGLPLNPGDLLTPEKGQVAGLGKSAVQSILKDHGIDRVLAEEGGRTSRGSIKKMHVYVDFLNQLQDQKLDDIDSIEKWWIGRVRDFFTGKPFVLRFDVSKSLRSIIQDLLGQAEQRQKDASGTMYVGMIMQHLVGAKLEMVIGDITHHGASVADEGLGRDADFLMGDVAIHVTTSPSEALIRKCKRNLDNSLRPLIVTISKSVVIVPFLAEQLGISDRIDVLDIEQFLTSNLYEHGRFNLDGRRQTAEDLLSKYNDIVSEYETDPSLQINFNK